MQTILYVMGPTCAGKSTILQRCRELSRMTVYTVEVGKMLRAKYGEDYFKGQAAPEHTQAEAWAMHIDGIKTGLETGKSLILVDGQPRDVQQAQDICKTGWIFRRSKFLLVHADEETRIKRACSNRKVGPDLDLAMARIKNDYRNCYVVLVELMRNKQRVDLADTSSRFDIDAFCRTLVENNQ